MSPEVAFCGLFDRIDRVTRAYEDEIARRGLKPESEYTAVQNNPEST
jgi:hypothetical protein